MIFQGLYISISIVEFELNVDFNLEGRKKRNKRFIPIFRAICPQGAANDVQRRIFSPFEFQAAKVSRD